MGYGKVSCVSTTVPNEFYEFLVGTRSLDAHMGVRCIVALPKYDSILDICMINYIYGIRASLDASCGLFGERFLLSFRVCTASGMGENGGLGHK